MTFIGPPLPEDEVKARPAWLKSFVEVRGRIPSAPLDLPARLDSIVATLRAAGWVVVVRSIGTDFEGPLGLPVPKDQELVLLLARQAPFDASDAEAALTAALAKANLGYSPISAWLRELAGEVVAPTVRQVEATVRQSTDNGTLLLMGLFLLLLKKR